MQKMGHHLSETFLNINVRQLIYTLSDALDLVGVSDTHHGKRVAYMSNLVGKNLNWSEAWLDELFEASILHDCGVSQTNVHAKLTQLQWEEESDHCEVGSILLQKSSQLMHLAPIIKYHHTHWDKLQTLDIPEHFKQFANCIYLVDRVDILTLTSCKGKSNVLLGTADTISTINKFKGSWFSPVLVESFNQVAAAESFWLGLENVESNPSAESWINKESIHSIQFTKLKELISIFSSIVDAKSQFTREHSQGVAKLSKLIGRFLGLDQKHCDMLEIAGLLHDLGKLRTPDEYLEKPSKLTEDEFAMIKRHSFDTFKILNKINGLDQIVAWAFQHHEWLNGKGYPSHIKAEDLCLEARIIAVADVFQALAQKRPYRDSLPAETIANFLKEEVGRSHLDSKIVNQVIDHLQDCWREALVI